MEKQYNNTVNRSLLSEEKLKEIQLIENQFSINEWQQLTKEDAIYLSKQLDKSTTVVSRDPEWLMENTKEKNSVAVYDYNKLIWFILMDVYPDDYHWKNIHERVSLRVDQSYRGKKIWKYLIMKITKDFEWQPIASYTPNEKVWHVSKNYLWFEEIKINNITPAVVKILESWWPLDGEWYKFYFNKELIQLMSQDEKSKWITIDENTNL